MFEKVNPSHPDKVADRIAGAIVDLCYTKSRNRWSSESRAKPRLSYAESRRKWAKAKDGTMMTKPDGSPMTKQV